MILVKTLEFFLITIEIRETYMYNKIILLTYFTITECIRVKRMEVT